MSSSRLFTLAAAAFLSAALAGCGSSGHGGSSGGNSNVLSVTAVNPQTGSVAGGLTVTITGTHFSLSPDMTITFGSTPATNVSVIDSTSLTCVTPASTTASAVNVTATIVSTGETATLSNGFTYTSGNMTITNVSPNQGPQAGSTSVTITGTNFVNITAVTFGGSAATISTVTATSIQCTTSGHAPGTVDVVVTSSSNGQVTATGAFTYQVSGGSTGNMMVTNVTPSHGPLAGGPFQGVTIDGVGFTGSLTITFAGLPGVDILVNGTTQVKVTPPKAATGFTGGPVNLTITSTDPAAGSVSLTGYSYDGIGGAPTLTAISPATAPESGGTLVTITGSNFLQGTSSNIGQVLIGSKQLTNIQIVNNSTLKGVIPVGTAGATTVQAFGTAGAGSNVINFTYSPSLFITGLNPNQGPTAGGGRSVTISGRNFSSSNIDKIFFAGTQQVPAGQITVVNSNTITVIPPASPLLANGQPLSGPVDVTITGKGIADANLKNGYNYGPTFNAPSKSVQPTNGVGVASVGTILAVQFQTAQLTGAVVIQPTKAFAYPTLGGTTPTDIAVATGTNFVDVAAADIDGDGDVDILILDATAKQIVICKNTNNTSFTTSAVTITSGGTPVAMAIGLFNNDGFYDVAVTLRGAADQIAIFKGGLGGTLTFDSNVALPAGAQAGQILCADPKKSSTDPKQVRDAHDFNQAQGLDVNGDGKADLVVALGGTNQVAVYTQTTPLVFTQSSVAGVGAGCTFPQMLALGDVDDNGTLDVVCGNAITNNISVFTGNGAGSIAFVASYALQGAGNQVLQSVVIGDFNRDCRADIVTCSFNGENISIYLGHGDGTFADATNYDAEIASRRAGATIQSISYNPQFTSVYALDQNVVANNDFVTVIDRATILFVQGAIQAPYATIGVQNDPQAITFGDLNKDGHKDMVVANRAAGTIQVFINDGNGNFTQPFAPMATGLQPESVVIADVNNDGIPDVLVACNGSDAVFVHRNIGGGQLAAGTKIDVNAKGPHQVVAVDMDGDSNVDFVTVNQYGNSVSVFVDPTGDGNFVPSPNIAPFGQPTGVFPVGNGPLGVAIADLNNDGRPDIVTANSNDDTVTVLLRSNGVGVQIGSATDFPLGGTIAPAPSQPAGTPPVFIPVVEPVSVAIADLNQDGFLDIVTADKFTSTVTILHGGKGGTAGNFFVPSDYGHFGSTTAIGLPPVKLVTPTNPVVVVLADMNDDGLLDIVVGSFGGSSVVDFITQGAKTQSAATGINDKNLTPPSGDQVPGGETAFVYDAKQLQILYKSGQLITFNQGVGSNVTSMAIGRLSSDCPPNVGTTSPDNNVRLFKVK